MNDIKIHGIENGCPAIQVTKDYSMFCRMEGNRQVTAKRAKDIRKSIESIGLVPSPIVVNERYEVIDGQGRLDAIQQLGLPVFYVVVPGLGLQDCVSMNVNSTPWKLIDYIMSYAETGNENYKRLLRLIESYDLPLSVAVCAATGVMSTSSPSIKTGSLELSADRYYAIDAMLAYVERFRKVMKEHDITNLAPVYSALCFCYQCPDIDNERMFNAFARYCHKLTGTRKTVEVLDALTDIYNFGRKKDKVYITTKYREYLDGKYPWYVRYWSDSGVFS